MLSKWCVFKGDEFYPAVNIFCLPNLLYKLKFDILFAFIFANVP